MNKKFILPVAVITVITLMSGIIDLNTLIDYESQIVPSYISRDNTPANNPLTNAGATLGRVLFYDVNLSVDNSTSCASCHIQEYAFGDTAVVSQGMNGVTGRHSMRLVNAQFSDEVRFFWDERATSLEDQSTKPIQDHVEMGFSGTVGDPDFDSLIIKLEKIDYYGELFHFVYGDSTITEERVQKALAQFVRSIHSFDSKYDVGRAQVSNSNANFPNFTTEENLGKNLFNTMPPMGGAGCARCHGGDEFSMVPNSANNGVIGVAGDSTAVDLTNTKAPSLRNLVNKDGVLNGPFMHDGSLKTLMDVVNHYNNLRDTVAANTNLDFRLAGTMHELSLNSAEKEALVVFLKTLTGNDIYTSDKWSSPFDNNGNITVLPNTTTGITEHTTLDVKIYPTIVSSDVNIELASGNFNLSIYDMSGKLVLNANLQGNKNIDLTGLHTGVYVVRINEMDSNQMFTQKIIKE